MLYYSSNKVVVDVINELGRAPARLYFHTFLFSLPTSFQNHSLPSAIRDCVLVAYLHQIQHLRVCNDMHTLCMCNYIHTTHTRRAFVRNLLVVGFPSAMVLRPDLFFAASLDSRRDSLLDAALHTFPFLRHLGVRY